MEGGGERNVVPTLGRSHTAESMLSLSGTVGRKEVATYLRKRMAVRDWLTECFAHDGIQIEIESSLYEGLQTGVLLCFLAQMFEARSVPRVHESPTEVFEHRENVVFFLAACEMFGVERSKLFRVNDLVDGQSMVAVVECLAALAQAVQNKWPDKFPLLSIGDDPSDNVLIESLGQEEYRTISKQLLARLKASTVKGSVMRRLTPGYRLSFMDSTEEVASVLSEADAQVAVEKGVLRLQAVFRGARERAQYQTRLRDTAYRERVVFEILTTEQSYVESLQCCVDVYLRPLEAAIAANKAILSHEKTDIVFRGLESIVEANSAFLAQLQASCSHWHPNRCVGDVFASIDKFLDVYTPYIQNYTEAVRVLKREQRKKKPFKEYLTRQKQVPRAQQRELDQFLIMPVQRIPRYNLLLRELRKHTWPSHPDYAAIDAAVERLANIAIYLNEKKRDAEALQRTFHVQEILDHAGVALQVALAGRKYMLEGELFDAHGKQVVAYLFSDLLIVCSDRNDRQHTEADERRANRKRIRFQEYFMLEVDMVVSHTGEEDGTGRPGFELTFPSSRRSVSLFCSSAQLRKEWSEALRAINVKMSVLATLARDQGGISEPSLPDRSSGGGTSSGIAKRGLRSHRRERSFATATTGSELGTVEGDPEPRGGKRTSQRLSHLRNRSVVSADLPNAVTDKEKVINPLFGSDTPPPARVVNPVFLPAVDGSVSPRAPVHSDELLYRGKKKGLAGLLSPRSPKADSHESIGADETPTSPARRPSTLRRQTPRLVAVGSSGEGEDEEERPRTAGGSSGFNSVRKVTAALRFTTLTKMFHGEGEEKSPRAEHVPTTTTSNSAPLANLAGEEGGERTRNRKESVRDGDIEKLSVLMRGRGLTDQRRISEASMEKSSEAGEKSSEGGEGEESDTDTD